MLWYGMLWFGVIEGQNRAAHNQILLLDGGRLVATMRQLVIQKNIYTLT